MAKPLLRKTMGALARCVLVSVVWGQFASGFALGQTANGEQDPRKGDVVLVVAPLGMVPLSSSTDFDDLHTLNIVFDESTAADSFGSGAVDAVNIIWLNDKDAKSPSRHDPFMLPAAAFALKMRDWQLSGIDGGPLGSEPKSYAPRQLDGWQYSDLNPLGQQNGLGLIYGLRALEKNDQEYRNLRGDLVQDMRWRTDSENYVVGPQVGMIWLRSHGLWRLQVQATVLAAYNQNRVQQDGRLAFGPYTDALNQSLVLPPSSFDHAESHQDFSPGGEIRAQASMQITDALSFRFHWSAVYLNNISLVQDRTVYQWPDLGLRDPGTQDLFIQDVFCGLEMAR